MINKIIKELVSYAKIHLSMDEIDQIYVTNRLLHLLKQSEPYVEEIDESFIASLEVPDELLNLLSSELKANNLFLEEEIEPLLVEVMGELSPSPSKVIDSFNALYFVSPSEATDYLYDLSIKNNYIQKTKVDKNVKWTATFDDSPYLEVSINLSKPEKNNADIKKLVNSVSSNYPKCLLCKENLGFAGSKTTPARENIRIIPITLDDEKWFLQYSPYVYYPHHLIAIYDKHVPMEISRRIVSKLCAFVDLFPHYFIGSNSDLPIVGGSILNHEHFQGGGYLLPIMKASPLFELKIHHTKDVKGYYLSWYNSTIMLVSKNKESLLDVFEQIFTKWKNYNDESVDIISFTSERHSTVTPIVRKIGDEYRLYIILRNNRTNDKYPDGIFHAHKEYHAIKKEGIGLIEAMGLFILPSRLVRQIEEIKGIINNNIALEEAISKNPEMKDFAPLISELSTHHSNNLDLDIKEYINNVCRNILKNTAVFKDDKKGKEALAKFIKEIDL